ncbi:MAG: hypothetical protein IJV02_00070 [Candidatus Methanomethylophilaceae archaeon]|nr:hypothetical protein [Candidatus Methanomethylophilaceae archaeon]MBR1452359.1 hypothetical protein [Candidatus Methanomethylophilaceae archaeon]
MTINLTQFPKKIFEDVYLTKAMNRKTTDTNGRTRKHCYILIPKLMAEEQGIRETSYIFKIKRLSDAYCENELMLSVVMDSSNPSYPYVAQLPEGNGFDDGQAVYVKAKLFDLEKWFKSRRSKGFDALTGYEEEKA